MANDLLQAMSDLYVQKIIQVKLIRLKVDQDLADTLGVQDAARDMSLFLSPKRFKWHLSLRSSLFPTSSYTQECQIQWFTSRSFTCGDLCNNGLTSSYGKSLWILSTKGWMTNSRNSSRKTSRPLRTYQNGLQRFVLSTYKIAKELIDILK